MLEDISRDVEKAWDDVQMLLDPDYEEIGENLSSSELAQFKIFMITERLSRGLSSVQHFFRIYQRAPSRVASDLLLDLQSLLQESVRLRDALKDRLSRRAAALSLEESRKAIETANSLKTLTKLAFDWPLSLRHWASAPPSSAPTSDLSDRGMFH